MKNTTRWSTTSVAGSGDDRSDALAVEVRVERRAVIGHDDDHRQPATAMRQLGRASVRDVWRGLRFREPP